MSAGACSSAAHNSPLPADAGAAGEPESSAGQGGSAAGAGVAGRAEGGFAGVSEGGVGGESGGDSEGGVAGTAQGGGAGDLGEAAGAGNEAGSSACIPLSGTPEAAGGASSVVLYSNDFETPNQELAVNCGNSLDTRGINLLYGTTDFVFAQVNTVEGIVVHDPSALYSDPSGIAKNYALGMLSSYQDDKLALTFEVTGQPFLNVGFDLSAIDVQGCGGPFGTDVPVMQVSLLDTPSGTFDFGAPGVALDQGEVTGVASSSPWKFEWKYGVVSLDSSKATGKSVTVLFDLKQSGYGAFDNLSIVSSQQQNVVDKNNNGIPDDEECAP